MPRDAIHPWHGVKQVARHERQFSQRGQRDL
jgi:hypothetical protein